MILSGPKDTPCVEERDLIERAKAGDREAQGVLYAAYQPLLSWLAGKAWHRERSFGLYLREDIDDLRQRCAVWFLECLQKHRGDGPLAPFLSSYVRARLRLRLRYAFRARRSLERWQLTLAREEAWYRVPDALAEKESRQRRAELFDRAWKCLTPGKRRVMQYRLLGFSCADIAERTGSSLEATRCLVSTARQDIAEVLTGGRQSKRANK